MSWTSLAGLWTAFQIDRKQVLEDFPLTIPGSIHLGLIEHGIIGEPTTGKEEINQKWIGNSSFQLSRPFPALPDKPHHLIRCSGIDTACEIYLDNMLVGKTFNEFVNYDFKLDDCNLSATSLKVILRSPISYCQQQFDEYYQKYGYRVESSHYVNGINNFNFLRKTSCSFAWDWGPSVPTLGIDHIGVFSYTYGYIKDVKCLVESLGGNKWKVHVSVYLCWESDTKPSLSLDLVSVDEESRVTSHILAHEGPWSPNYETEFEIVLPPWRVVGTDDQVEFNTLYKVIVTLQDEGQTVDRAVGFRKVELIRKIDDGATEPSGLPLGESFYFQVNGVPVFAKGSNYIPSDVFKERGRRNSNKLLRAAVAAGMNCLRIWGGGRYEDESFYLECDRLGILLWHDMMYACSLFPGADPAFLELCRLETLQQLRRLAGHPCIALWAANNENEELMQQIILDRPGDRERLLIDYQKLYIDTIWPTYLSEMRFRPNDDEPAVPFWPSSPSNGIGVWGVPGEQKRGDVHYWGVWHGNKPFEAFQTVFPRFCSEFGFQSAPSYFDLVKSIYPEYSTKMANELPELDGDKLNWTSPEMEYLQRSPARGNLGIVSQMMSHLRFPTSFKKQVWASQLLQGLAMQSAVSSWRRLQPYCMGALYWQLNDIWTGMSWSTINHSGTWKLSHYFVKRAFARHNLSFKFIPSVALGTSSPSTEDAPFSPDDEIQLWLSSDFTVTNPENGGVLSIQFWLLSSMASAPIFQETIENVSYSNTSRCLWSKKGLTYDKHDIIVRAILSDAHGRSLSESEYLFLPIKRMWIKPVQLTVKTTIEDIGMNEPSYPSSCRTTTSSARNTRVTATLSANRVSLYATLEELTTSFDGSPWSQNGLVLYPGESRTCVCTVNNSVSRVPVDEKRIQRFLSETLLDVSTSSSLSAN